MSSLKVYLACGLTHVPRQDFAAYIATINQLAVELPRRRSVEVKYAIRDSDPQLSLQPLRDRARLCYSWDRQMVEWADIVVGEASYPSTGLGIELQIAAARETPIILLFRREESLRAEPVTYTTPDAAHHYLQLGEGYISLMALGLPSIAMLCPYVRNDEVLALVESALTALESGTHRAR
jgi:hypothetical protein